MLSMGSLSNKFKFGNILFEIGIENIKRLSGIKLEPFFNTEFLFYLLNPQSIIITSRYKPNIYADYLPIWLCKRIDNIFWLINLSYQVNI